MIRVKFDPTKLNGQLKADWNAWEQKAWTATETAIAAWEDWRKNGSPGEFKFEFDESIWGELKAWLVKNVFHDKCAYCETREVRSPYHAEHFRPKGRVTIKTGPRKQQVCTTTDENDKPIKHPGYFWLAYDWTNLLPSCNYCNTAQGKKNQFPVKNKHISVTRLAPGKFPKAEIQSKQGNDVYYLKSQFLDVLEDPLLLHPYLDDPQDHLVFGEFGVVAPRNNSDKGRHSIEVYNLDSGPLTTERQIAQDNALRDYTIGITTGKKLSHQARINAGKASIAGYIKGEEPYSAAVMANLRLLFPSHGLPSFP